MKSIRRLHRLHRGFTFIRLLILVPILISIFLMGFLSADWARGVGNPPQALSLLRMHLTHWLRPSQNNTDLAPHQAFRDVLTEIRAKYYGQPPSVDELTYRAIDGMLAALHDPYTRFMEPKEFKQMQEDTRGDFVGIGAQLDDAPDGALVVRPIPKSPAERAGLKAGDVIIKVNGKSLKNISLDGIVRMIRGERHTKVRITVRREGAPKPLELTITRDLIETPTVDVYLVDAENKIYRIWLQNFSERADDLLDQALKELDQKGCQGLILDLRYNPGGLLDSAVEVASRFLKSGVVVIIRNKRGEQERKWAIEERYHPHTYPIVVLVNGGSASASEIVAGALKDHKIATIIGETTFGKGLVQTVITTSQNTAVAITTAKYYTPHGTDINRRVIDADRVEGGIKPDIEVEPPDDWNISTGENDLQLQKAAEFLRQAIQAKKTGSAEVRAQAIGSRQWAEK